MSTYKQKVVLNFSFFTEAQQKQRRHIPTIIKEYKLTMIRTNIKDENKRKLPSFSFFAARNNDDTNQPHK